MQETPRRVQISKNAYLQIQESVERAEKQYEVGGVLVGYQEGCALYIEAATTCEELCKEAMTSFVLDGEYHTQRAKQIIDAAEMPMSVLGVWHSHICDTARFSAKDRASNRTLAKVLGGVLSVLVAQSAENAETEIKGNYISEDGTQYSQEIKIK